MLKEFSESIAKIKEMDLISRLLTKAITHLNTMIRMESKLISSTYQTSLPSPEQIGTKM